jgi:effector-binding domain-containing protein
MMPTKTTKTKTSEPKIDTRAEQPYVGIRTQTPMKGMFKVIDKLFREMEVWAKQHSITPSDAPFLRYHVIDMEGTMDIEVGYPVAAALSEEQIANERVKSGVVPAGRYASLVYVGNGYTGNKTLIEWARDNGYVWDAWDDPAGHAFRSRYERYLTDPKVQLLKSKWEVEVAIKLAD